jgi:hypothetical protein
MVSSGPISLGGNATTGGLNQSVNIELNRSATATINMNESAVRTLFAVPSGAISMSNGYGKSNRISIAATISSDTANYTVNTAKASGYIAGVTDFTLTINSGVFVFSGSTGSYAMTVDTSWAAGDTVTIVNNGTIVGRGGGGGGGGGGSQYAGGSPGGGGGPALLVQRAITMNNLNRIAGGGGGGGGQGTLNYTKGGGYYGGGGGGGGIGNGSAGGGGGNPEGAFLGIPGTAGTLTSAGNGGRSQACGPGGSNTGGAGGGYGSSGAAGFTGSSCSDNNGPMGSGGSGGVCIQGNSNITYINTGTRNGTVNS